MTDIAIHEIDEGHLPDFLARIGLLSKKSMKLLGKPIEPVFHGEIVREVKVNGRTHDLDGNKFIRVFHRVSVTGETPKINGWTFVGTIDHAHAAGNLLRAVPGAGELPIKFRTAEPYCEHCAVRRRRNDTFILRSDDGVYKQIGRQCLRDFIGYDVAEIVEAAKWLVGLEPSTSDGEEGYGGGGSRDIFLRGFLAHCHAIIRKTGWVSKKDADIRQTRSTASLALENMFPLPRHRHLAIPLTERDHLIAGQAIDYARALTGRSDYEYNLSIVAQSDFVDWKSLGLAASIIPSLFRHQEAVLNRAERLGSLKASKHVGSIGERLRDVQALVYGYRAFEGFHGVRHLFRLRTPDDCVLLWWASSAQELSIGDRVLLTGTVKKHEVYEDIAQTTLIRCVATKQVPVDAA